MDHLLEDFSDLLASEVGGLECVGYRETLEDRDAGSHTVSRFNDKPSRLSRREETQRRAVLEEH